MDTLVSSLSLQLADSVSSYSDEDLDQIKAFLSRFKTQPGKRREESDDPMVDMDDEQEADQEENEPRHKYLETLVSTFAFTLFLNQLKTR